MFPDRWAKAVVVAGPPALNLNLGEMLTRVVERIRAGREAAANGPNRASARAGQSRMGGPMTPARRPTELPMLE